MACLDDNTIAAWFDDRMSPQQRELADSHLGECQSCREILATWALAFGSKAEGSQPDSSTEPSLPVVGESIGRYQLREYLGRGAMGAVFVAHDPELDRRLAIKLVRPHYEDQAGREHAQARLLREAQAVARLRHPHLVTIYDVGTWHEQVYLAMELVEGQSLRSWVVDPPPWRTVVDAYADIADGLGAVHGAGLVHRDIKPDNLLVDAAGQARIIDFGLARATDSQPLLETGAQDLALSQTGTLVGTPAYMAPELFRSGPASPKSDLFALSVSLFETLFGKRPFDGKTIAELARQMREQRAVIPSSGASLPGWLKRAILRGLSAVPADRHSSLDDFARALRNGRRRSRKVATAALVMLLAVLAVGIGAAASRAPEVSCDNLSAHRVEEWQTARGALAKRLEEDPSPAIDAILRFFDERAAEIAAMRRRSCLATHQRGEQSEELLDRKSQCLDQRHAEQLALATRLLTAESEAIQSGVRSLQRLPATSVCEDHASLSSARSLPEDPLLRQTILEQREQLAAVQAAAATGDYLAGIELARALQEQSASIEISPLTAKIAYELGDLLALAGQPKEAVSQLQQAVHAAEAGADDATLTAAWIRLTDVAGNELKDFATADGHARHARAYAERSHSDKDRANLAFVLGKMLTAQNRYDEAHQELTRALALATDHPLFRANVMVGLATIAQKRDNDLDQAGRLLDEAIAISRAKLGDDHPDIGLLLGNRGLCFKEQGQLDLAREHLRQGIAILEAALGRDNVELANNVDNLATVEEALESYEAALELRLRALAVRKGAYGDDHVAVANSLNNLGNTHIYMRRFDEALKYHEEALSIRRRILTDDHPDIAMSLTNLAILYRQQGDPELARRALEEALAVVRKKFGDEHLIVAQVMVNLGNVHVDRKDYRQGLDYLHKALALRQRLLAPDHPKVGEAHRFIAELYQQKRDFGQMQRALRIAVGISEKSLGPEHPSVIEDQIGLGRLIFDHGDRKEAIQIFERARQSATGAKLEILALKAELELLRAKNDVAGVRALMGTLEARRDGQTESLEDEARRWLANQSSR